MKNCLACRLNRKPELVPGGRIFEGKFWNIEHCITTFGVGSVVIKTKRHIEQYSDCSQEETEEFGELFFKLNKAVEEVCKPEQIYISKWGEETDHFHLLIQPVFRETRQRFNLKGPTLQAKMVEKKEKPDWNKAEKIAIKIKSWMKDN